MGFFNNFPYTNFHEVNLDWILAKIRELEALVSDVPTEGGLDAVRGELTALRQQLTEAVADLERDINNLTASDVGALPDTVTRLPNPANLTFTGAAAGNYDGSQPVTIDIPAGGGGGGNSAPLNFTGRQTASYDGSQAVDIDLPEKLANPKAITFTGGVSGTYDGSEPMTVNIPTGGSGDVQNQPLTFTGAVNANYDGSEQVSVNIPAPPTKLPNPKALTFTGAVSGTYDGSAPLSVVIPQGGGISGAYSYGGSIVVDTAAEQGAGTVHVNTDYTFRWGDILLIKYAAYNNTGYSTDTTLYTAVKDWLALGHSGHVALTAISLGEYGATHALARTVRIKKNDEIGGIDIEYGTGYRATIGQSGASAASNIAIGIGTIMVLKHNR